MRRLQTAPSKVDGATATAVLRARMTPPPGWNGYGPSCASSTARKQPSRWRPRQPGWGAWPGWPGSCPAAWAAAGFLGGGGGVVAGVGAAAVGLAAMAKSAGDAAVEVATLASLTGASVADTSKLAAVWQTTGAEIADLADVIAQVNGVLADQPELARRLGIELEGADPQRCSSTPPARWARWATPPTGW